mgnify:CR=1 FL=1|jgi:HSP20 family protein
MLTRTFYPTVFRNRTRARDQFCDFRHIQEQMNRLVAGARLSGSSEHPPLNVWSNQEELVVQAELPGFAAADIDISVVQQTLTVSGSRKPEELKEGESFHRRERWTGQFERSLKLPFEVASDGVEAEFKSGVLSIRLPRAEESKPKKIAVKTA